MGSKTRIISDIVDGKNFKHAPCTSNVESVANDIKFVKLCNNCIKFVSNESFSFNPYNSLNKIFERTINRIIYCNDFIAFKSNVSDESVEFAAVST